MTREILSILLLITIIIYLYDFFKLKKFKISYKIFRLRKIKDIGYVIIPTCFAFKEKIFDIENTIELKIGFGILAFLMLISCFLEREEED